MMCRSTSFCTMHPPSSQNDSASGESSLMESDAIANQEKGITGGGWDVEVADSNKNAAQRNSAKASHSTPWLWALFVFTWAIGSSFFKAYHHFLSPYFLIKNATASNGVFASFEDPLVPDHDKAPYLPPAAETRREERINVLPLKEDGNHHHHIRSNHQDHHHLQQQQESHSDPQQCLVAPSKVGTHHYQESELADSALIHGNGSTQDYLIWSLLMKRLQQNNQEPLLAQLLPAANSTMTSPQRVQAVLDIMKTHVGQAVVQQEGCWLLAKLTALGTASQSHNYQILIADAGGVPVIIEAMQRHPQEGNVQEQACAALRNLALDTANEEIIAKDGGIIALVQTMQQHPNTESIQEQAIGALRNLAGTRENKELIGNAGGVRAILHDLEQFSNSPSVIEQAFAAIRNLALNRPNRQNIAAAGGIAHVAHLMNEYFLNSGIQEQGVAALGTLAYDQHNREMISRGDGLVAITKAMQQYKANAAVQSGAIAALDVIGFRTPDIKAKIVDSGGMELILQAMEEHGLHDSELAAMACSTLTRILSYANKQEKQEHSHQHVAALRQILKRHPYVMRVDYSCNIVLKWFVE